MINHEYIGHILDDNNNLVDKINYIKQINNYGIRPTTNDNIDILNVLEKRLRKQKLKQIESNSKKDI